MYCLITKGGHKNKDVRPGFCKPFSHILIYLRYLSISQEPRRGSLLCLNKDFSAAVSRGVPCGTAAGIIARIACRFCSGAAGITARLSTGIAAGFSACIAAGLSTGFSTCIAAGFSACIAAGI